ncbi:MAG TPA: ABC transporter permease [Vicinamibacterales bacterium]|nr:ABC transporter permease [Vicinamibacterales bacterium]
MLQFLVRRFLWAIFLFVSATVITYLIFYVVPSDPAKDICGRACTEEDVARVRHFLHLDEPIYQQYGRYVWNLVAHGSLGTSYTNRQEVNHIIGQAAPVTASLVFGGAVFWLLLSLPVGIYSALRARSLVDRAAMTFVLVGVSAHPVWIGLILSYFLGYRLHLTPIAGYCDFFNPSLGSDCGGPVQWAYHMLLPWTTFMLLFAALYVRFIRANVMETMTEDYVRTARAKGASERRVLFQHVLRNSLLPVVTILGMDIGLALGGAIFTESVYSLPGLGRQVLKSYEQFDLPVILGIVVFSTICIIIFNLIVDILYAVLDPRIRLE